MIASLIGLLDLLLASAELGLAPTGTTPLLAVVLAAAVVVTTVVVLTVLPALVAGTAPPLSRPIDPSTPVAESDPDAAGHARPRAPGRAIRVA